MDIGEFMKEQRMKTVYEVFSELFAGTRLRGPETRYLIIELAMLVVAEDDRIASIEDPQSFVAYLVIDAEQSFVDGRGPPLGVNRHHCTWINIIFRHDCVTVYDIS